MKKLLKDMSARDMPDVESNHGKQQFYMQIAYSVLDSIETRKWNAQGSKINIDNNSVTMKITPNGIEVTTKDKDFEYFNVKNIDSEKKREEQRKELVIDIKEYITSYLNKNKKDSINKDLNTVKSDKDITLDMIYETIEEECDYCNLNMTNYFDKSTSNGLIVEFESEPIKEIRKYEFAKSVNCLIARLKSDFKKINYFEDFNIRGNIYYDFVNIKLYFYYK